MISNTTIRTEIKKNTNNQDNQDNKGSRENWKVFAECVRDAMSKHSEIPKKDDKCTNKDKEGWYKFMQCK